MKKIIITIAFEKQADHPITFEEIDIELQDGDIINAGYEEPFYGSDSGHDGYFYLHIERKREETDEEEKEREKIEKLEAEVTVVDVETKINRIAERLAQERLDREMKELGGTFWQNINIFRGKFWRKYARRNAAEAYLEKYKD